MKKILLFFKAKSLSLLCFLSGDILVDLFKGFLNWCFRLEER